jgi:putative transcriptional regulator
MANQKKISRVKVPYELDVSAIRLKTRCPGHWTPYTQDNFARLIGVPEGTLRQWEQGRRKPTGAARVLLAMLDRNPHVVVEMLQT